MRIKGTKLDSELIDNLLPYIIIGAEGDEGDGEGEGQQGSGESGTGDGEGDEGEGNGEPQGEPGDNNSGPDVAGLKSALEKERKANREKEKELKALRKAKEAEENAKKSDLERAQAEAEANKTKAERLAEGFLRNSLHTAIRNEAQKLGFIDVEDAIAGVSRDDLSFEQDEDDPSDIDIDMKSVTKAVKALAAKKPHFIKTGTEDGEPSGSQFGGSKQKKKTSDDQLRDKYPSLR